MRNVILNIPVEIVEYVLTLLNERPRKESDHAFITIQQQAAESLAAQEDHEKEELVRGRLEAMKANAAVTDQGPLPALAGRKALRKKP